jgi:hypothetical protein
MAETMMDYARPMIDHLPNDHSIEELKAIVVFAAMIWNIQFLEEVRPVLRHLVTRMPPRLRVEQAKGLALIRRMLTWKQHSFAGDSRAAVAVDVFHKGDELHVKAIGVVRIEPPPEAPEPNCWDRYGSNRGRGRRASRRG